jgi:hypothetical protein
MGTPARYLNANRACAHHDVKATGAAMSAPSETCGIAEPLPGCHRACIDAVDGPAGSKQLGNSTPQKYILDCLRYISSADSQSPINIQGQ